MNYDEMKTGESTKINMEAAKPIKNNSAHSIAAIGLVDIRSGIFKIITIIIAALGFFSGIIYGAMLPLTKLDYKYPTAKIGDMVPKEAFNWPLMIGIWVAFALIAISFWAIYCHLSNQEETIAELKRLNYNITNKD